MKKEKFELKLNGKACVMIDWANVYGWQGTKVKIEPKDVYKYFNGYREIDDIRFYFGLDENKKSTEFLNIVKKIGYVLVSKPVKYIVYKEQGVEIFLKRKCDFDLEIGLDCFEMLR